MLAILGWVGTTTGPKLSHRTRATQETPFLLFPPKAHALEDPLPRVLCPSCGPPRITTWGWMDLQCSVVRMPRPLPLSLLGRSGWAELHYRSERALRARGSQQRGLGPVRTVFSV